MKRDRLDQLEVIAPNFKKRLSGVTATVFRLVPLQAQSIAIATIGPRIPDEVPSLSVPALLTLSRKRRVWHARRNTEMLAGILLRHILRKDLALLFTSASQRHHTGYTRWLIRQMDHVIATSDKTASYLDRGATVIHHGIDTNTFYPIEDKSALRRSLGLPDTGRLIGCYGRIRGQKGTDVFVDAMIDLLPRHPDTTALVMGRATAKHEGFLSDLRTRVSAAGLDDRILFLPEVPVLEMPGYYQVLDLFVAPQRWEGFGLTPLEAMSCAVPCVATRVGAFDELIVDGETGILVAPGDGAAMIAAIESALGSVDRLGAWSVAALKRVEQRFRIEQEAEALIRVYRQLLAP